MNKTKSPRDTRSELALLMLLLVIAVLGVFGMFGKTIKSKVTNWSFYGASAKALPQSQMNPLEQNEMVKSVRMTVPVGTDTD